MCHCQPPPPQPRRRQRPASRSLLFDLPRLFPSTNRQGANPPPAATRVKKRRLGKTGGTHPVSVVVACGRSNSMGASWVDTPGGVSDGSQPPVLVCVGGHPLRYCEELGQSHDRRELPAV
ncbi:hypothetical protein ZWY2020_032451 [Hordeum vulgare]|nr:hypothetical protein ZWY2020_041213 [Hordeum vulgare]KAI5005208.1 hypothetical protein ZWY2020_032451 [Hordeum vulgare]